MTKRLRSVPQLEIELDGKAAPARHDIPSEIPAPPTKLSAKEKRIWTYITTALHEYGLIHKTDALMLSVICKTFNSWATAEVELAAFISKNGGSLMVETPNGYAQPHQLYYLARSLKKELLDWLPEAALTIPSFAKAVENRQSPIQGTLFEDPVELHRKGKPKILRAV